MLVKILLLNGSEWIRFYYYFSPFIVFLCFQKEMLIALSKAHIGQSHIIFVALALSCLDRVFAAYTSLLSFSWILLDLAMFWLFLSFFFFLLLLFIQLISGSCFSFPGYVRLQCSGGALCKVALGAPQPPFCSMHTSNTGHRMGTQMISGLLSC